MFDIEFEVDLTLFCQTTTTTLFSVGLDFRGVFFSYLSPIISENSTTKSASTQIVNRWSR